MNTLHLFAGAGGGIIADMMLGHTPVGAVEINDYCCKVLEQRQRDGWLPKFPIFRDVREFDGSEISECVDCVCGGFPCQDISCAGKGGGISGTRSGLFYELVRICCNLRPPYIFMENSPFIVTRGLDSVLREVSEMGYDAEWCCLPAAEVGGWHRRERWWCLCKEQDYVPDTEHNGASWGSTCQRCVMEDDETNSDNGRGTGCDGRESPRKKEYTGWWQAEPGLGRVADGVADRVDRIKAVGNGQVPACAVAAWKILWERIHS